MATHAKDARVGCPLVIQNTQNRDARALHIKLDELLRTVGGARGSLADVEDCSEDELRTLKQQLLVDGDDAAAAGDRLVGRGRDARPHPSRR